mgnify:CR=1 FL=1
MKFVVVVGDGMADEPIESLGGRTPLQAARTPNFDRVVREGVLGRAITIPQGMPAGSDVANLSIMGYDPRVYYTGRGPLEAASLGVELGEDDVAYRCNLVTLEDGRMKDYSAGHISSEEAGELIDALNENLKRTEWKGIISFHAGKQYRHLMVWKGGSEGPRCTPPHDILGEPFERFLPQGEGSELLRELIRWSWEVLREHPVNLKRAEEGEEPANSIWPWGQGRKPSMPGFEERFGVKGAAISAVDLVKGISRLAGLRVIEVPGATGYLDTNYKGKAEYALKALEEVDFVYIHVEAPDEASHAGDVSAKVEAIERIDEEVVGRLIEGIERFGKFRMMVMTDHYTPISIRTHTRGPVPFAVWGEGIAPDRFEAFSEEEASKSGLFFERGWELMGWFLGREVS